MVLMLTSTLARTACAALAASVVLGGSLSGCTAFTNDSVGLDNGLQVAAAFYPLAWVSEQVGGDHVEVTNLTKPGGEPHDLEPSVEQTADIAQADLVVYERGFQPAVDA